MKTAKPLPSDPSSSRRAQPVRQTRTNPSRASIPGARPFGPRSSLSGGLEEKDVEIFPAITHFADSITALPKELMRHFTLLKEVDAKIFAPEDDLGKLVDAALSAPLHERRPLADTHISFGPGSIPMSAQGSTNGSIVNGHPASVASIPDADAQFASAAYDPANIPRRQLFQHCAFTMQNMLVSLDEKNHVISTAAEALTKQLARIDDCFPYIELEISDEARYGSTTHWAYPENRTGKAVASNIPRREAAAVNTLSAAAQQLAEEAAARSDARKQALLAKKNHKQAPGESDFDETNENRQKESKKSHAKVRKAADASLGVGLGITTAPGTNGNAPKRRKVEKGPTGGVVMERALSGVFGNNGTATKGKAASPRETPGPDAAKKKPRTINGTSSRKRNNTVTAAMSPSIASSPIRTTFPDPKALVRISPPPTNGARPVTSRARQNSTQSIVENIRPRQESVASIKPNGIAAIIPDPPVAAATTSKILPEVRLSLKELANGKVEHVLEDSTQTQPTISSGSVISSRKDSVTKKEDTEVNGGAVQIIQQTAVTTKSGRASKPSTPAMPSFPDPPRSRSARNVLENGSHNKRSHKKGAGAAAQLIMQQAIEDDTSSNVPDDDEEDEPGPDEPRYCYCNGVSYGEMVACDADDCKKEWFHLECAGLKVAPRGNAKWYCDECKDRVKSKRLNAR
ncbi:FYVE/PHD zinc finger [Glarea lozoyensis ATCC 20868]|uniref:Chromatin modification-related protein n=1 Tax=Glarea lozoyensis (strain ATCC 20868 / MF5171) TaxID=1116229 RepID=S3E170_GLAL2|nr:FYVE/PHD zinc finger [Glarea lozoyensis ATCC 20868]EPE32248.1 FYVE/PHD zinc finger [Glarea lozoyensis ATCC 20868]